MGLKGSPTGRTDTLVPSELSALIAKVYDAALDPAIWPGALEGLCRFTGGGAAFLYFQDLAGSEGDACYAWGDDPGSRELRFRSYARFNPATDPSLPLSVGTVTVGSELLGERMLRVSRLYSDWMQPGAYCDFALVLLARSNLRVVCLTVAYRQDQHCIEPGSIERLGLVAPHFQRSAAIAEVLGQRKIESAAFAEVLNRLSLAVFLVDADGQVVHANRIARAMLDEASVLNCRRDVLEATDRRSERSLRLALSAAVRGGEPWHGGDPLHLRAPGGVEHLVHILPLTSGFRKEAGLRLAAAAAVFVHEPSSTLAAASEVIGRLYELTSGELRVLRALVEGGGSTREIALALNISENTVNTHLRHLFEKTGVRRQADLVRMVAANVAPFEV